MEPEKRETRQTGITRQRLLAWMFGLTILMAAVTFGVMMLLITIYEQKQEARNPFFRVVELTDDTVDPAIWGKNFPLQYDGYRRTVDMVRTRFGGSEAVPRTPTKADPRSLVAQSRLEEDPRLKTMWAGYAFATDFREERGHAYMLLDQTFTRRVAEVQQPGSCVHCHASVYETYKELGDGDIFKGFDRVNHMSYNEAREHVSHPVACIDCHDPATMQLRVTRPAFIEGIRNAEAAKGNADFDVNLQATRQQMRTFVCAQCHVEYYFAGKEKRLTFPWHKGLRADDALAYYDEIGFHDWIHKETGAKMLKAQHPEFELWSQGTHARAGVTCSDCHMPYERVGAMKISDHHIRSPMLNINNACQTCHPVPESELRDRAELIQAKTYDARNMALDALLELIGDIKQGKEAGFDDAKLDPARNFQRKAQFLLDYVEAENSMGFHADQEAMRLLSTAINYVRQGQNSLREKPASASP